MLEAALEQVQRRAGVLADGARRVARARAPGPARRRSAGRRRSRRSASRVAGSPASTRSASERPAALRASGAAGSRERDDLVPPLAEQRRRAPAEEPVAPVTRNLTTPSPAQVSAPRCARYSNGVSKVAGGGACRLPALARAPRRRRPSPSRPRRWRRDAGPAPALAVEQMQRRVLDVRPTPIVARPPSSSGSWPAAAASRRNLSTTVCDSGRVVLDRARPVDDPEPQDREVEAAAARRACPGTARRRSSTGARGRPARRTAASVRTSPLSRSP